VRRGGGNNGRLARHAPQFAEALLELALQPLGQDVLDGIRVAIHVIVGDGGLVDQVQLPEAVRADQALGLARTLRRERDIVRGDGHQPGTLCPGQDTRELGGIPGALELDACEGDRGGDGGGHGTSGRLLRLGNFIDRAERVLDGHAALHQRRPQPLGEHALGGGAEHRDDEDRRGAERDDGTGGELGDVCADERAHGGAARGDAGAQHDHDAQTIGPETRGRGWNGEHRDDQDQSHSGKRGDGGDADQEHEHRVDATHGQARGVAERAIEAEDAEVAVEESADQDDGGRNDREEKDIAEEHARGFAENEPFEAGVGALGGALGDAQEDDAQTKEDAEREGDGGVVTHEALLPGGLFMIYNIAPALTPPGEAFKPWSDGRCGFERDMLEAAGFEVLAYDQDDAAVMRQYAVALGWDGGAQAMDLEKDFVVLYTLARKKPAP
jgi:hypothetical protein